MNHNHSIDLSSHVPAYLIGLPAGQDSNSSKFQDQYGIAVDWDVKCAACCWTYLTQHRRYTVRQGDATRVTFGQTEGKWTQCYISPKQENSKHGQFKTDKDPESYGKLVAGPLIKKNSTIRLYSQSQDYTQEPTVIGTTINVIARVESIAAPNVIDQNVKGSCLSYNHAAIFELYRVSNRQPALQGTCEIEVEGVGIKPMATADTTVKTEKHSSNLPNFDSLNLK